MLNIRREKILWLLVEKEKEKRKETYRDFLKENVTSPGDIE